VLESETARHGGRGAAAYNGELGGPTAQILVAGAWGEAL